MPLTEDDLDRIADKLTIAVSEAMEKHIKGEHSELTLRLGKLERAVMFYRGAMWTLGGLFALTLALIERSH